MHADSIPEYLSEILHGKIVSLVRPGQRGRGDARSVGRSIAVSAHHFEQLACDLDEEDALTLFVRVYLRGRAQRRRRRRMNGHSESELLELFRGILDDRVAGRAAG